MRYFVTGASGFIGSALVAELHSAGHEVVGLARSDEAAERVAALGADVLRGTVDDLDVLRRGAEDSDGVAHLAFRHDLAFSGDFATAVASDRAAIEALGDPLAGSGRPLTIASGTALLTPGSVGTEDDRPDTTGHAGPRAANAELTLALADRGARTSVVRLTPTVHGAGDHGFIPVIVETARRTGRSAYVGDGSQRWPAVHVADAARLFRLALEQAPAGSVLHAVGEEGVALREVAELIGERVGVPTESISPEQAAERFGFLGGFVTADMPASSARTRELLGWQPTGPGLLEDMAAHYFDRALGSST